MAKEIVAGKTRRITIKAVKDSESNCNDCECCDFVDSDGMCELTPVLQKKLGLECASKYREDKTNVHFKLSKHWK